MKSNKRFIISLVITLLLLALSAVFFSGQAFGQDVEAPEKEKVNEVHFTADTEVEIFQGDASIQEKIFLTYAGKNELGLFCWIQIGSSFKQLYCGPTYQPKDWIQFGAGVGLTSNDKPFQSAAFVWVGKGKFSDFFIAEKGGGGLWVRNEAAIQTTKEIKLSWVYERYAGNAARIDLGHPKIKYFTVGAEYYLQGERKNSLRLILRFTW